MSLWGVLIGVLMVANLLALAEIFSRPAYLLCDCHVYKRYRIPHLDSIPLFMVAVLSVVVSVLDIILGMHFSAVFYLFVAALYFRAWWIHTRNKRKKLKDKVLGVVKVTVAGLKVEPVPVQ